MLDRKVEAAVLDKCFAASAVIHQPARQHYIQTERNDRWSKTTTQKLDFQSVDTREDGDAYHLATAPIDNAARKTAADHLMRYIKAEINHGTEKALEEGVAHAT